MQNTQSIVLIEVKGTSKVAIGIRENNDIVNFINEYSLISPIDAVNISFNIARGKLTIDELLKKPCTAVKIPIRT